MKDQSVEFIMAGRRHRRHRWILVTSLLAVLACALCCAMLLLGNTIYPVKDVISSLSGEKIKGVSFAVNTIRLPRMLTGLFAGFAFGIAGYTFQTMLRNPLANPNVIGITSGSSAAAVFCIVVLHASGAIVSLASVIAGLATVLFIYVLSRGKVFSIGRLILIGIGIQAMLDAVISYLLLVSSEKDIPAAIRWLTGSLNGSQMSALPPLVITVLICSPIIMMLGKHLSILELGEQSAFSLGVDIVIPSNKISVIIGSNGCGKSTLLKTMARLVKPTSGSITLDGKAIGKIPPKQLARVIGLLPQSPIVPEGISVADLVGRGRFPHQSLFSGWTKKDYEAVAETMTIMNITEFANHNIDELSGGQRQRVWIAMALAQQTDILFLDEPTTFLDITYQVEILDLLTELNRKHGTTIVMVLHDINLSARYADHIFALHTGKLVAEGKPAEVITAPQVKDIFGLECTVIDDPVSGSPLVVPKGRYHAR